MTTHKRLAPQRTEQEGLEMLTKRVKREEGGKWYVPKVYFAILNLVDVQWQRGLTHLDLSQSQLRNMGFLKYLRSSQLVVLNLNNNHLMSLRGLERSQLPSLELLYLRYNQLRDDQPLHLTTMPRVLQIYLNQNHLSHLQEIKLWFTCRRLSLIQLSRNRIVSRKGSNLFIQL